MAAVLVLAGLASAGAGGVLLSKEMGRHATPGEIAAAGQAELASRWERVQAGKIFPASLSFGSADSAGTYSAQLVGIAPAASCSAALDARAWAALSKYRCTTVLRATYADSSGTMAVTIGIAVMSSAHAASLADTALSSLPGSDSVQAAVFPDTIASGFGNPQRAAFTSGVSGPYLIFIAGGDTDGRAGPAGSLDPNIDAMVNNLLLPAEAGLRLAPAPCALKDVRC